MCNKEQRQQSVPKMLQMCLQRTFKRKSFTSWANYISRLLNLCSCIHWPLLHHRRHLPAAFWVLWNNHQHLCAQSCLHTWDVCTRSLRVITISDHVSQKQAVGFVQLVDGCLPARCACCFSRNPRVIRQEEKWRTLNGSLCFSVISSGIHIATLLIKEGDLKCL